VTGCKTTCTSTVDCASGFVCRSGACLTLQDDGGAGATGSGGGSGTGASSGTAGSGGRSTGGASGATNTGGRGIGGSVGIGPDAGTPDAGEPAPLSLPKDEGGCGCATPGRSAPRRGAPMASVLALSLVLLRRRRRTPDGRTSTIGTMSTQGVPR
jgi:hypothetical protein